MLLVSGVWVRGGESKLPLIFFFLPCNLFGDGNCLFGIIE